MSDESKIEPCPRCKNERVIEEFSINGHIKAVCSCGLSGPWADTPTDAINAWNQIAMAFKIARTAALVDALKPESRDEAAYYAGFSFDDGHETAMRQKYGDEKAVLVALLAKWRQTDG